MSDVTVNVPANSIRAVLAILPSGEQGAPLTFDELGDYLKRYYDTDEERDRNKRHMVRDELYRDGGNGYMATFIDNVFQDRLVRELRKKFIPYAKFNNAIKRIVNEQSTVYSEPAHRLISQPPGKPPEAVEEAQGAQDDDDDERYQRLLQLVRMDERAVEIDRMLSLHRALLVGFRVRQKPDKSREPVLDIATPANVRAITHPNDNTEVVGWLIRIESRSARDALEKPAWTLWTDYESVQLTCEMKVIGSSYQVHDLGMVPWVPVTLGPPAPGFWPGCEGEDLVAAHISIWFQNILTLKETKSATKQTIITGDGTAAARAQAADTEVPGELADGQSATTVDMSMDVSMFQGTSDHILANTAYNYGMSPAIMTHQGVQSAEARELMRLPLKEIRRQRQVPLRRFEQRLAEVMSTVTAVDMPELTFDPKTWRIEFRESDTPLDPKSELELDLQKRSAGLTNTVDILRKHSPGLTVDDAFALMEKNVVVEVERNKIMRPLQQISGSMGAATDAAAAGVHASVTVNDQGTSDGTGNPPPQA